MFFDASDVAPETGGNGRVIPAGETVQVQVIESEVKELPKGMRLNLTLEVLDGEFSGSKIWTGVNFRHENPVAQKIGQGELSAYCHATGKMQIEEPSDLHFSPFYVTVDVEDYTNSKGEDKQRNGVKKIHLDQGSTPPASKPAPAPVQRQSATPQRQTPPAAKPAGSANLPWKKNAA